MKKATPKQQKNMQIAGVIILLLLLLYFWRKRQQSREQEEISSSGGSSGAPKPSSSGTSKQPWEKKYDALPTLGDDAWLKKGSKSKEVWAVQWLYNEHIAKKEGRSKISVDGIFGSQTESAVKYVNGYTGTRLQRFRVLVKMTKSAREAEKTKGTNSQTAFTPPFPNNLPGSTFTPSFPNYSSESTFIYNPYGF
jgi:hypothetical protein